MKRICILISLIGLLLSACSRGPEPIQYGKDACSHCKMTIMDKRFAAEIVTAKGKVYKFDSAECMADFLKENSALASNDKTMFLVSYYDHPGTFENATNSIYLKDEAMLSPMGGNIGAFTSEASARSFGKGKLAETYNWAELLKSREDKR